MGTTLNHSQSKNSTAEKIPFLLEGLHEVVELLRELRGYRSVSHVDAIRERPSVRHQKTELVHGLEDLSRVPAVGSTEPQLHDDSVSPRAP